MKRTIKVKWGDLRVGLLLIFAVAVMFWASLSGGGTSIFDPKGQFICYFRNVNGLLNGSPVWMAGVEIGNVRRVEFVFLDSLRQVKVTCRVKKSVWHMITTDARASLGTIGILGDKYLELIPGTPTLPQVKEGDVVMTQETADLIQMMEEGKRVMTSTDALVGDLDTMITRMNRGEGTLGKLATDEQLYAEMTKLLSNLTILSKDLHNNQERLTGSIERVSNSIADVADQVKTNSGTLGRIVNDPALYDNLAATSARLDTIMQKINAAEGSAGLLVNDTALYVEVTNLMVRVNNLVADIERNPRKYFKFSVF